MLRFETLSLFPGIAYFRVIWALGSNASTIYQRLTMCRGLHVCNRIQPLQQSCGPGVIISPSLQIRKLRPRKVKAVTQGYTAGQKQCQEVNSGPSKSRHLKLNIPLGRSMEWYQSDAGVGTGVSLNPLLTSVLRPKNCILGNFKD